MILNSELQKMLQEFPSDLPVAFAIKHTGLVSLFYELEVQCAKSEGLKVVILSNEDINEEYSKLYDGETIQ